MLSRYLHCKIFSIIVSLFITIHGLWITFLFSLYSVLSALLIDVSICPLHITVFSASVLDSAAACINCLFLSDMFSLQFQCNCNKVIYISCFSVTCRCLQKLQTHALIFYIHFNIVCSLSFTIHLMCSLPRDTKHPASVGWLMSMQPMYSTSLISGTDKPYFFLSYMQLLNLVCHIEGTCLWTGFCTGGR